MADTFILQAGVTEPAYSAPGGSTSVSMNYFGALKVDSVLGRYSTLAAKGVLYVASAGVVANAVACVADVATTAAQWALYNGNATGQGGYHLHILGVSAWQASGTPAVNASIMVGLSGAAQAAALTAHTGSVVKGCTGSTSRASSAVLAASATLTSAAAWMNLGGNNQSATAGVGSAFPFIDLGGAFVVPPTWVFGVNILSGVGTSAKYGVSILYAEIPTYLS